MSCARTRQLAQAYVDRELELSASLTYEEHLADCAGCRQHHAALRQLRASLNAELRPQPAPESLRTRLAERLGSPSKGRAAWLRGSPALLAVPIALLLMLSTVVAALAFQQFSDTRVPKIVYHINESTNPATALRNLANVIDSTPEVKAVVVAHNRGVDFLLAGARDAESGEPFETSIARLAARGVDFRVCGNTLAQRAIDPQRVVAAARLVPSGIAEIARLQTKERYAYVRL